MLYHSYKILIHTFAQITEYLYLRVKLFIHAMKELKEKIQAKLKEYGINLSVVETEQATEVAEAAKPTKVACAAKATLEDGSEIFTDSDAWAIGINVYSTDAEGNDMPLADGEYMLADGTKIVVSGGVVSEIETPAADITEEQPMDMSAELNAVLSVVANLEKKVAELTALNTQLSTSLKDAEVKLSATPAAASVTEAPVIVAQNKQEKPIKSYAKMTPAERVMANLNKH